MTRDRVLDEDLVDIDIDIDIEVAVGAGHSAAVAVTTLIRGRPPQVHALPPEAGVPPGWEEPG